MITSKFEEWINRLTSNWVQNSKSTLLIYEWMSYFSYEIHLLIYSKFTIFHANRNADKKFTRLKSLKRFAYFHIRLSCVWFIINELGNQLSNFKIYTQYACPSVQCLCSFSKILNYNYKNKKIKMREIAFVKVWYSMECLCVCVHICI